MNSLPSIFDAMWVFFVTALGFDSPEKANRFRGQNRADVQPVRSARSTYVQSLPTLYNDFDSYLTKIISDARPQYLTLRSVKDPKSEGYNVALMVEGPRKVNSRNHTDLPCYVVWSRMDGKPFVPVQTKDKTKVFAARSGRGVVIAREIDRYNGLAERVTLHVLGVEFSIFDSDPKKDDVIKITKVFRDHSWMVEDPTTRSFNPSYIQDDFPPDSVWPELIMRAKKGLDENFLAVDEGDVKQLLFFNDQCQKYYHDAELFKSSATMLQSWRDKIRCNGLKWSLEHVKEAWQLMVIIDACIFGDRDAFVHSCLDNTPRTRYGRMLDKYGVTGDRRTELWNMVKSFVQMLNHRF